MRKVGARETDIETTRFGETSYAVATPDQRERPKEKEEALM